MNSQKNRLLTSVPQSHIGPDIKTSLHLIMKNIFVWMYAYKQNARVFCLTTNMPAIIDSLMNGGIKR